jgi:hypothetical protein
LLPSRNNKATQGANTERVIPFIASGGGGVRPVLDRNQTGGQPLSLAGSAFPVVEENPNVSEADASPGLDSVPSVIIVFF